MSNEKITLLKKEMKEKLNDLTNTIVFKFPETQRSISLTVQKEREWPYYNENRIKMFKDIKEHAENGTKDSRTSQILRSLWSDYIVENTIKVEVDESKYIYDKTMEKLKSELIAKYNEMVKLDFRRNLKIEALNPCKIREIVKKNDHLNKLFKEVTWKIRHEKNTTKSKDNEESLKKIFKNYVEVRHDEFQEALQHPYTTNEIIDDILPFWCDQNNMEVPFKNEGGG